MDETEVTQKISPEMEQIAARRAKDRAGPARWDLDIAVFMFFRHSDDTYYGNPASACRAPQEPISESIGKILYGSQTGQAG